MKKKGMLFGWLLPIVVNVLAALALTQEEWRPLIVQILGLVIVLWCCALVVMMLLRRTADFGGGRVGQIVALILGMCVVLWISANTVGLFSGPLWLVLLAGTLAILALALWRERP